MKLQFLIFSIFLITLVANKDITNATILNVDSERTFISLIFNQSQYFTMYAIYNCKYTFKIKAKSTSIPSSSSLSLLYIGHKYFYPDSIITLNNEYGSLNNSYSSINSNYTITLQKYFQFDGVILQYNKVHMNIHVKLKIRNLNI